jgi:hypothetical protein
VSTQKKSHTSPDGSYRPSCRAGRSGTLRPARRRTETVSGSIALPGEESRSPLQNLALCRSTRFYARAPAAAPAHPSSTPPAAHPGRPHPETASYEASAPNSRAQRRALSPSPAAAQQPHRLPPELPHSGEYRALVLPIDSAPLSEPHPGRITVSTAAGQLQTRDYMLS